MTSSENRKPDLFHLESMLHPIIWSLAEVIDGQGESVTA